MNVFHRLLPAIVGCALIGISTSASADIARGEELHNKNCIACHASNFNGDASMMYLRPDRKVKTYDGLLKQVTRCENMLGYTWFDDEIKDVADYLNQKYYKFDTP